MTRAERTYYIVSAGYNLSWAFLGAVYPLFLLSRGLDLFQINAILATYFIANFLFEVPTGAIADLFGRKVSFLLSCAIRALAFVAYYFSDSFWEFVGSEILDALGTTLASGALDAWAVDQSRSEGDERPADRLFAHARSVSYAAMITSGLAGGYVGEIDIAYPWLVGVAGFVLTAATAALLMTETRMPQVGGGVSLLQRLNPVPAIQQQVRGAARTVIDHPMLRYLCLLTGLISFAVMPFLQLWPPQLSALSGSGTSLMGWVWAGLNVASLCGSLLLPRVVARFDRRTTMVASSLLRGAGAALAASATGFQRGFAGVLLQSAGMGASDPLLAAWANEFAESEERATVLSIQTMSFMLGGSAGLLLVGGLARGMGIPTAWTVCSLVMLACALVAWRSVDAERRLVLSRRGAVQPQE